MKKLTIWIAVAVSSSCYGQRLPVESENSLICSALVDYRESIDSTKKVVVLSTLAESNSNRRLLFEYLSQNRISFRIEDAKEFKTNSIRGTNCLPAGILVTNDHKVYDFMSTAYRLPHELETNILAKSDSTFRKNISEKLNGIIPISLGKPWYWKNYAVVSVYLFTKPYVFAYHLKDNKWQKLGVVYDPR